MVGGKWAACRRSLRPRGRGGVGGKGARECLAPGRSGRGAAGVPPAGVSRWGHPVSSGGAARALRGRFLAGRHFGGGETCPGGGQAARGVVLDPDAARDRGNARPRWSSAPSLRPRHLMRHLRSAVGACCSPNPGHHQPKPLDARHAAARAPFRETSERHPQARRRSSDRAIPDCRGSIVIAGAPTRPGYLRRGPAVPREGALVWNGLTHGGFASPIRVWPPGPASRGRPRRVRRRGGGPGGGGRARRVVLDRRAPKPAVRRGECRRRPTRSPSPARPRRGAARAVSNQGPIHHSPTTPGARSSACTSRSVSRLCPMPAAAAAGRARVSPGRRGSWGRRHLPLVRIPSRRPGQPGRLGGGWGWVEALRRPCSPASCRRPASVYTPSPRTAPHRGRLRRCPRRPRTCTPLRPRWW